MRWVETGRKEKKKTAQGAGKEEVLRNEGRAQVRGPLAQGAPWKGAIQGGGSLKKGRVSGRRRALGFKVR